MMKVWLRGWATALSGVMAVGPGEAAPPSLVWDVPQLNALDIDGQAEDWGQDGFDLGLMLTSDGEQYAPEDLSVRARLAWTAEGLVLLLQVHDDVAWEDPEHYWRGDSVEVILARDVTTPDVFGLLIRPRAGEKKAQWWGGGDDESDPAQDPELAVTSHAEGEGYTLEVRLPWAVLGASPLSLGDTLGFQVAVRDRDDQRDRKGLFWNTDYRGWGPTLGRYTVRLSEHASGPRTVLAFGRFAEDGAVRVNVLATEAQRGRRCFLIDANGDTVGESVWRDTRGRIGAEWALPADHPPLPLRLRLDEKDMDEVRFYAASLSAIRHAVESLRSRATPTGAKQTDWPADLEDAFWLRARDYFESQVRAGSRDTYQSDEKYSYPAAITQVLAGDRARGLALLQAEDRFAETDHAHTLGIDWFWSFTIKQQVRKYFLLGDLLDPDYRQRMYDAAKIWTASDPLPRFELAQLTDCPDPRVRAYAIKAMTTMTGEDFGEDAEAWRSWAAQYARQGWQVQEEAEREANPNPHPLYGRGTGGIGDGSGIKDDGFGPKISGTWVDTRNNDNLRAMRETSVYLMAEETGNELTRRIYKEKIRLWVRNLYHFGMGEWDSPNYLPHTINAYLNLYDFARDPEARDLAEAALDWMVMSAALKYYRGGVGPGSREFGGASHAFASSLAHPMYLWFGDCPLPDPDPRYDDHVVITSRYRPPLALVALAHKRFERPVELLNTKPNYNQWKPGLDGYPVYFESLYFGRTYYLNSVLSGEEGWGGKFRLLADNAQRGVDYVFIHHTGRLYKDVKGRMGQYRNLAVYMRPNNGEPVYFQWPRSADLRLEDDGWYIGLDGTYLAIRPIGLGPLGEELPDAEDLVAKWGRINRYWDESLRAAEPADEAPAYLGAAVEVGEAPEHASFEAFIQAVRDRQRVDLERLGQGRVALTGTDGCRLTMTYRPDEALPRVERDGVLRDFTREWAVYASGSSDGAPVELGWRGGELTIRAGGRVLQHRVTPEGRVSLRTIDQ